jgi:hypothetical protein
MNMIFRTVVRSFRRCRRSPFALVTTTRSDSPGDSDYLWTIHVKVQAVALRGASHLIGGRRFAELRVYTKP